MANSKQKNEVESLKITCPTCGRNLGIRNYYVSSNNKYKALGYIPFCKTCIIDMFKKSYERTHNIKKSIMSMAMSLDIPYDERNIVPYIEDEKTTVDEAITVFYEFVKMTNSVGKKLLLKTSFDYEEMIDKSEPKEEDNVDEEERMYLTEEDLNIRVGREEISFFGNGYTKSQYIFLTKSFLSLAQSFDVPNSVVSGIYKDLCFLDLRIEEAKHNGTSEKDIIAMMDARRKLFKDADISLYEKKGDEKVEGVCKMVRRMELTRPAADPLPEWGDNKLKELSDIIAGHILMADGYDNKVVQDYKKVVEPYSIDTENLWGEIEDD